MTGKSAKLSCQMVQWIKGFISNYARFCKNRVRKTNNEKLKQALLLEMNSKSLDGRPLTHRRIETLMLVTGLGKKETIRLLREIGARPSGRFGAGIWTMKPKR